MKNIKTSSIERKIKSLTPNQIKKIILFFLVNKLFGKIIKISQTKINLFGGQFDYNLVSDIEAARIFFGFWESAEIRFAKRFALSKTIIELGSCVGVTLGVLSKFRKNTNFVCVEASKINFEKLSSLKKNLSNSNNYTLINKVVTYDKDKIAFLHTTTTGSKIDELNKDEKHIMKTTTLSMIINENKINEKFTLITDISGAEDEIFFKDSIALKNCETIIAELENTSKYSVESQIKKLLSLDFYIKERYGDIVVMISNK